MDENKNTTHTHLARRREQVALLQARVADHDAAVAAWMAEPGVDNPPVRRMVRAELELAEAYQAAAKLYRPGSVTAEAMRIAVRYLEYAVFASPVGEEVRAAWEAERAVSVSA